MREEFEKMAAAGKLERHHIEPLVQLTTTGFCMHRSWGFGRIKTMDPVFGRFTIDFDNKADHTMDLAFAAESLKPIPRDHILARKASDPAALRQMAAAQPLELVKLVVTSYGGKATVDQIQHALVPDVIGMDWKKWWELARRELKKDGHFQVPLKKSLPVIYQVQEVSLQDRLMEGFRTAKGLKARVAVATELLRNVDDLADKTAAGREVVALLNVEIPSYQRTQPAVALEAIFARDDLRGATGLPPGEGEVTAQTIWTQDAQFGPLLEQLPSSKHRRALESFKAANPEHWHDAVRTGLNTVPARLCRELAGLLIETGQMQQLKDTVARLISQHNASSELLLWLAKDRDDSFADILGPEVFRAMLTAMERDQFNERRSNRLRDYILDDHELLVELIGSADLEVIKDLTRALQLSPSFDDMDKRSLLARIVKSYPAIQVLISGEQPRQEATLMVSWASLERRKCEYRELVEKKIPANSKEIALARSYGDLSENHEYKAAKEMQKLLMRRKADLETELVRARGTDFAGVRTDVAGVGTVVRATDLVTGQPERIVILGAWDSEPDKEVVSYLSPMAQALLGHKVGDEVEFEVHEVVHRHRLDSIEPYVTAPAAPPPVGSQAGAETASVA
ncbi:MAG TPA: GreA/GreB family elongation factor [Candidatus Paceibacterota bacterium]|nr:GreA/GreB family elongation factor [Verrucomicrobiota bacterium]HSA11682.1 GreA/GreB family elongation factor [Candidatus Paceibacterota bacterium]